MKKKLMVLIMTAMLGLGVLPGCGSIERVYDEENYESITNEKGNVALIGPDGTEYKLYKNVKIIYADSDSLAIWFKTADGRCIYWQGYLEMDVKSEFIR